ncbi:hypothetical protein Y032_0596g435 [Ancylostoma ceylanicum]|uniref:Uncharacterized protein n=1 Tax=Ancylostoma ceylanicum TaxID=53326 RepID=A0A016WNE7_9BILA|nr:hypothetical protein Y032_0596g435 [Ancylostoma ceylanicum]
MRSNVGDFPIIDTYTNRQRPGKAGYHTLSGIGPNMVDYFRKYSALGGYDVEYLCTQACRAGIHETSTMKTNNG